ncbi:type II 3-dehydroquinate dehydratase [bacterium]|nr:type II 3-dehydroquinate dehydratase [bacterium]
MKLLILNGPNLNLLGEREPEIYGTDTLIDINYSLEDTYPEIEFTFLQSNSEGELINWIHQADSEQNGIIFNPAAYTHTSVALRDAISSVKIPCVEVHLSNLFKRTEPFRQISLTAGVCKGVVSGFGKFSYHLAVEYFLREVEE